VIVLSRAMNEKLFTGEDSVGRTLRLNDREFRVVGVLDEWLPMPKFYDLNNGAFNEPEDTFIPFGFTEVLETLPAGNVNCWKREPIESWPEFFASECVWQQMWVELPDASSRERFQAFVDSHWARERANGRFARPRNNRLTNVGDWLRDNQVVQNDNRVLVGLAFAFLAVCLLNTVGLMLAKFLNAAPLTGIRRALGASRRQVFAQHLTEVGAICLAGAMLGMTLGAAGLWALRQLYTTPTRPAGGYAALAHFDTTSVVTALALAGVAALIAGLYPAWRIGRLPPAVYLKNQ
jgi:putative ABC transport system permease protein